MPLAAAWIQGPCCLADGPDDDAGAIPGACRTPEIRKMSVVVSAPSLAPGPRIPNPAGRKPRVCRVRAPHARGLFTRAARAQARQGACKARTRGLSPQARVSPGFPFPVPRSLFPAFGSYPQRRMAIRPCQNHQIRVKIGQKGDRFRPKPIKTARISSCPS